nr:hypothetical protein [Tanacetum cinerariifolium]
MDTCLWMQDLFVADGEGLPRSLVEVESKFAHQILSLFSLDDKEASKFLKLNYHLPASSDYVDPPSYVSTPKSPMGAEFLRSASVRWGEKGNSSFRLLKKRFQEVQGGSFRWS